MTHPATTGVTSKLIPGIIEIDKIRWGNIVEAKSPANAPDRPIAKYANTALKVW